MVAVVIGGCSKPAVLSVPLGAADHFPAEGL